MILNGPTCTHALFQGKGGSVKATTCGFDRGLRVSRFEFTWIDHTVTPPLANRINISYSDSKTFPKRICILRVTLLCINHNPGVISRPLTYFFYIQINTRRSMSTIKHNDDTSCAALIVWLINNIQNIFNMDIYTFLCPFNMLVVHVHSCPNLLLTLCRVMY